MRKKVYGKYKVDKCPFCGSVATIKNPQGIPVCPAHKNEELKNMKCACGSYLDIKEGKYGVFFLCMSCGPINLKKALDINGYPLISVTDL